MITISLIRRDRKGRPLGRQTRQFKAAKHRKATMAWFFNRVKGRDALRKGNEKFEV